MERLWSLLEPKVNQLFDGVTVLPSLLHGDLWSGNVGETKDEPGNFILIKSRSKYTCKIIY